MTFGIIGNIEKEGLRETVRQLLDSLDRSSAEYCLEEQLADLLGVPRTKAAVDMQECIVRSDMIVAFGGDGTILSTARRVGARGTPILGVNLGKLGFLAEVSPAEMERAIEDILAGRYLVEDRLVLEGTTSAHPGKTYHGVNDMVVEKSRSPRVISIDTYIDEIFAVRYRGDGLIISTPTGSTAYALSNNGPIVTPTTKVIGITPISPHTLSGRPLIVSESCTIRVVVHSQKEEILFSSDGQIEEFLFSPAELVVRKAGYNLRLVKRTDRSYFDVLRAKLHWGQDPRSS